MKRKPAKPIRRWAVVENGELTNLIYTMRSSALVWTGTATGTATGRRVARVEIREVVPKRKRRNRNV